MTIHIRSIACSAAALVTTASLFSCAPPGGRHPKPGNARRHFEAADENKDGKLSFSEFDKLPLARKSGNPGSLFNRIDTNDDDDVSQAELRNYRKQIKAAKS